MADAGGPPGEVVLALASVGLLGVPGDLRLRLSEAAIESAGRDVLEGRSPRRAGLYAVEWSKVTPSGCAVLVTHTLLVDEFGSLYCSRGADSYGFEHRLGSVPSYQS